MNQAATQFDLGYEVYQRDFNWYVAYDGKVYPYHNGMLINRIVKQLTLAGEVIQPDKVYSI